MASRRCNWCGKQRTKFSGVEKQCIISNQWSEMCTYCHRRHRNVMTTNPFAGMVGDRTRQKDSSPQQSSEPK